jgi:hypothetical protein
MNLWYKRTAITDFAGHGSEKRRCFRGSLVARTPVNPGR